VTGSDSEIVAVFEPCDDALQGLIAYHFLVTQTTHKLQVSHDLLNDKRVIPFKITHEWSREYGVGEFFAHVVNSAEFQHCRTMLLAIIPQFEVALRRVKSRLWNLGKLGSKGQTYAEPDYKPLLSWAFQLVRNTRAGSSTMQARLPEVCGDVDNARRLRNLSMHENNYFTQKYVEDAIDGAFILKKFVHGFVVGQKILLVNSDIDNFLYSHIELLHMFHNTVQRKFFGCTEDYNYEKMGKMQELYRMISGRAAFRV